MAMLNFHILNDIHHYFRLCGTRSRANLIIDAGAPERFIDGASKASGPCFGGFFLGKFFARKQAHPLRPE
jgi:hypothetical protein